MYNPLSLSALGLPSRGEKFDTGATFVRSHIVSPYKLACLRALIALYCWMTIIVAYSWLSYEYAPNTLRDVNIPTYTLILGKWFIAKSFSFFTFITYWSLAFYFTISLWHTFIYARNQAYLRTTTTSHLHDTFPRWLQLAHSLWYSTITTYPFLVSIVYWCTMYGGPWPSDSPFTQWINISVHGLNSLFAILEIVFSAVRPPPFISHLLVVLTGLSLYLGVAYITKAHQGIYVYEWMNPTWGAEGVAGHVFGYAAAMVGIYSLGWGATWTREWLVARKRTSSGQVVADAGDVWQASELSSVSSSRKHSFGGKSASSKQIMVSVHEV
ncbi:Putative protein rolling stone [Septoria linicola]|uniref:Uncharacterized protein n=1 Tax=Septoria linicola TaxID=215465 RepID=A0A9Q9AQ94_9PEZI|nr:putative protein rolling stone [Septoria linicola]USW53464.1 Putative protein rolling stone [Septoria linicola]